MSSNRNNLSFQSNAQIDIRRPDNRLSISVTLGGKMHRWNNICVLWYVKYYVIYTYVIYRSDEGLTLETSAFLPFTVANLRFQPSC